VGAGVRERDRNCSWQMHKIKQNKNCINVLDDMVLGISELGGLTLH
jgi:hypothetical protein